MRKHAWYAGLSAAENPARRDHKQVLDLPVNLNELNKQSQCKWIKKQHKAMVKKWHPDKAKGNVCARHASLWVLFGGLRSVICLQDVWSYAEACFHSLFFVLLSPFPFTLLSGWIAYAQVTRDAQRGNLKKYPTRRSFSGSNLDASRFFAHIKSVFFKLKVRFIFIRFSCGHRALRKEVAVIDSLPR